MQFDGNYLHCSHDLYKGTNAMAFKAVIVIAYNDSVEDLKREGCGFQQQSLSSKGGSVFLIFTSKKSLMVLREM